MLTHRQHHPMVECEVREGLGPGLSESLMPRLEESLMLYSAPQIIMTSRYITPDNMASCQQLSLENTVTSLTCSQVPHNQAVNTEDGADRGVDDVEDGHDDTDEGEEEPHQEEYYHCHEDALPHHGVGGVRLLGVPVRAISPLCEGRRVLTGRAECIVSSRSRDIITLDHKVNI